MPVPGDDGGSRGGVGGRSGFTLVLSGGGARGFAHAGVLRALERYGYRPDAVVGVSMGAVVGATYALRPDWYRALLDFDTAGLPPPLHDGREGRGAITPVGRRVRHVLRYLRFAWDMLVDWGVGSHSRVSGPAALGRLLRRRRLEDGRIPVAVCATDLRSGERVVFRSGDAAETVYASSALAGVFRPLERDGRLLVDGAYTDNAPVDVARSLGRGGVVVVDVGQPGGGAEIRNGLQCLMRAMEICHRRHADLRYDEADVVLRPEFRRSVDTLEMTARRDCVAAGIRAVRRARGRIADFLEPTRARMSSGRGGRRRPGSRPPPPPSGAPAARGPRAPRPSGKFP